MIETAAYLRSARIAGMTPDEMAAAVDRVSADPNAGAVIVGSGGCRKVRIAGRGKGKSGGYRVITFWIDRRGVYLLWVISKGQASNLTRDQINTLADVTKSLT